ncbi:MAG: M3 family oligoendopeptidase [archaeon]
MKEEGVKWNLDHILKKEDFEKLYADVENKLSKFDEFFEKMSPDISEEDFIEYTRFSEALKSDYRLLVYLPALWKDTDNKSEEAKLLDGKVDDLGIKYGDAKRKIGHWIIGKTVEGKELLDDENAQRLFDAVPELTYVFEVGRESEKHVLSELEEKIISKKDVTGLSVLKDLRDTIETELTYFFKPKGAKKGRTIKSESELLTYLYSSNSNEREAAYTALYDQFGKNINKFFLIYQGIVKNWNNEVKLRNYDSSISRRNHWNEVPDKAIEVLLDSCSDNKDVFQQYFKFKAKELGMDKLRIFDLYAPLTSVEQKMSYDDAIKLVLNVLDDFSPNFSEKARKIIDDGHIDSHPNPAKMGGAFCAASIPSISPYVFLNFNNSLKAVSTLAHELGHGIHDIYADKQSISAHHPSLPLAETASTFAEMILFENMLKNADDGVKKSMLSERMSDSYATIMRQSYFVKFEIAAHEAISKGVTSSELSNIYFKTLEEQFGDSVDLDPMFKNEWAVIPHFMNTPFYCYAYNFGELLSLSLFSKYKQEGDSFIPKIEKILSYGGSKKPEDVLQEVGIDMASKDFWNGSFNILRGWQEQLEKYQ